MAEQLITSVPTIPHPPAELERQPLVLNQRGMGWLSDRIAGIVEGPTPRWWWIAFVPMAARTALSTVPMFHCGRVFGGVVGGGALAARGRGIP